jgi:hypothetical protein
MPFPTSFQYFNFAVPPCHFLAGLLHLLIHHKAPNTFKLLAKFVIKGPIEVPSDRLKLKNFNGLYKNYASGIYFARNLKDLTPAAMMS